MALDRSRTHSSDGNEPQEPAERKAAASVYTALMTQTCLDLIGAEGPVVVEGPFALNQLYLEALHTLSRRDVYASEATTGTAIGAALLTGISPFLKDICRAPAYAEQWRKSAEKRSTSRKG